MPSEIMERDSLKKDDCVQIDIKNKTICFFRPGTTPEKVVHFTRKGSYKNSDKKWKLQCTSKDAAVCTAEAIAFSLGLHCTKDVSTHYGSSSTVFTFQLL